MLERIESDTGPAPRYAVIWLHGLGADGNDFAPIVPALLRPGWPSLRFIFPHAPLRAVTINGGYRMRAWYDIQSLDFNQPRESAADIAQSIAQVEALIAEQNALGIDDAHIVLAGFSQGGAIVLSTLLQHPRRLGAAIAWSSYLPTTAVMPDAAPPSVDTPLLIAHGRADPIVPFAAGQRSAERLRALGYRTQWQDYPMEHSVCDQQIADLARWLQPILSQD